MKKILSVIFAALHLLLIIFGDTGHTDVFPCGLRSIQALSNADSGGKAAHKGTKDIHACQACYRAANSVARSVAVPSLSLATSSIDLLHQLSLSPKKPTHHYSSETKRGPPALV